MTGIVGSPVGPVTSSALRGHLTERQLSSANITISWNHEPRVVMVEPVIQPVLMSRWEQGEEGLR
jgi:hypothetical protein